MSTPQQLPAVLVLLCRRVAAPGTDQSIATELMSPALQVVDFEAVAARGHFVYGYLRESDLSLYYVGYSYRAKRPFEKHALKVPDDACRVVVLRSGLTQVEGLRWEKFFIFWYGRADLGAGRLRNRNDGGSGGKMGPEAMAKASASKKGVSTEAIRLAAKKRGNARKTPFTLTEIQNNIARLRIYSGRPDVVLKHRETLLRQSFEQLSYEAVSWTRWCAMSKPQRRQLVHEMKAADLLGIALAEYQGMTRGQRISATRDFKFAAGTLGTRATGPLSVATVASV